MEPREHQKKVILDATLKTIAKNKLSGTRMRYIAKLAGMSQGNLHYYFPNKKGLILDLLDYMLEHFISDRAELLPDEAISPTKKLRELLNQKGNRILFQTDFMLVFYDLWVLGTKDPKVREKMAEQYEVWRRDIELVVQDGVKQGDFDPRFADQIPKLLVSLMEGAALQYLIDPDHFDLEAYFTAAHEMTLRLLGVEIVPA
jgi:TetR/AcrR family transcriptional regulator